MLRHYPESSSLACFDGNRSYNLDLNKLDKPYLKVHSRNSNAVSSGGNTLK